MLSTSLWTPVIPGSFLLIVFIWVWFGTKKKDYVNYKQQKRKRRYSKEVEEKLKIVLDEHEMRIG